MGIYKTGEMEKMARRGVIYSLGPSPLNADVIWAGTDDGRIHLTKDGGLNWQDVTPSQISSWDKVSQIDASYFDQNTAYVAINAIRKDDMEPYIYKTNDGGSNWKLVTQGLPANGPVNVVRADLKQEDLLFAGTE